MNSQNNLIDQLEDAVSGKGLAQRADMLRRVTDLFLAGSGKFSEVQIELFDEVMERLLDGIEVSARAEFGVRLADAADAPRHVLHRLAFDDAIQVAGPILVRSEGLSEEVLIQNAQTMDQQHLLAISKRRELREGLTDVLVTRGNREVLISTTTNSGSRFSRFGFSTLVDKSSSDEGLALSVWSRPDIPRQELVRLFRQASEGLRLQLEAARPTQVNAIRTAVSTAMDRMQTMARWSSEDFHSAERELRQLHAEGQLTEDALVSYVSQASFGKITLALSLLLNLPIRVVELSMAQGRYEQIILFAKALEFSWNTTLALLQFQARGSRLSQVEVDQYFASFARMQVKTAKTALQFYQLRESSIEGTRPRTSRSSDVT